MASDHLIEILPDFPQENYRELWDWMNVNPDMNFDDYSPKSYTGFILEVRERIIHGEAMLGVRVDGKLAGFVAVNRSTPQVGMFHGICFAPEVVGKGIARQAVGMILDKELAMRPKMMAFYFGHNAKMQKLTDRLGAFREARFFKQTTQHGKPVDLIGVAFYAIRN
jgi:RimJ/RimL family protein N-acetyltransferase